MPNSLDELPPWEGPEDDWTLYARVAPGWIARGDAQRERQRKGVYQQPLPFDAGPKVDPDTEKEANTVRAMIARMEHALTEISTGLYDRDKCAQVATEALQSTVGTKEVTK